MGNLSDFGLSAGHHQAAAQEARLKGVRWVCPVLAPAITREYPDDWQGRAPFPAAPELRLEARGSVEPRQELELGLRRHLVGFVHQDDVEPAARRVVLAEIVQAVERGHVALLATDVVKGPRKLVRERHAEGRLPAARRSDEQDRHRPGRAEKIGEQPLRAFHADEVCDLSRLVLLDQRHGVVESVLLGLAEVEGFHYCGLPFLSYACELTTIPCGPNSSTRKPSISS